MGIFRQVRGQEAADQILSRSLETNRLAHAYLFAGPEGVGRLTAALELAATRMCSEISSGYCGSCRDCRRVMSFSHPDVRITVPVVGSTEPDDLAALFRTRIEDGISPLSFPGNAAIAIHQVREMEKRLSMKSFEGNGHIEIFTAAHRMRIEAANALLKTLEEPPDNTVIILVSSSWRALLPTVRSRSHLVRFRRLPTEAVVSIIEEKMGITPELALKFARMSDGCPGRALIAAAGEESQDLEGGPADVLERVISGNLPSDVISMAVSLAQKLRREGTMELVTGMRACMHDIRRVARGLPPLVIDLNKLEKLRVPDDAAQEALEIFNTASERLRGNGMARVVLSAALLGLWELVSSATLSGKGSAQ